MNDEQSFINSTRQILDSSAEQLDADISRRLRLARAKALESYTQKHSFWKPAGGFALATMMLIAIGIWQFGGNERGNTLNGEAQAIEDLELIASSDSLQLYENLEFYQWLEVIEGDAG
jgi:hypothetical protein